MVWVRQGSGGYFRDGNSEALVGADNWFFFLGIAIGAAAGMIACRLVRRHGPLVAVALGVGSLGGSYLAAVVGHWVTLPGFTSTALVTADGKSLDYFLTVRAGSTIFAWPFAAELALLLFTLLRWPRETPAPLSTGPAALPMASSHAAPTVLGGSWSSEPYPVTQWPDPPPGGTRA